MSKRILPLLLIAYIACSVQAHAATSTKPPKFKKKAQKFSCKTEVKKLKKQIKRSESNMAALLGLVHKLQKKPTKPLFFKKAKNKAKTTRKMYRCNPQSYSTVTTKAKHPASFRHVMCKISFKLTKPGVVVAQGGGHAQRQRGAECYTYLRSSRSPAGRYGVAPTAFILPKTTSFSHVRFFSLPAGQHTISLVMRMTASTQCTYAGVALEVLLP